MTDAKDNNILRTRLQEALDLRGLSVNALAKKAKVTSSTLYYFVQGKTRSLNSTTLEKVSKVLDVSPSWLLGENAHSAPTPPTDEQDSFPVIVRAYVQAGLWQPAEEWMIDDCYTVSARLPKHLFGKAIGLEVRGESMNKVFNEGAALICATPRDIGTFPQSGDYVVVQSYHADGTMEATVKELELLPGGGARLWPRSSNPDFSTPIELADMMGSGMLQGSNGEEIQITHIVIYAVVRMDNFRIGTNRLFRHS